MYTNRLMSWPHSELQTKTKGAHQSVTPWYHGLVWFVDSSVFHLRHFTLDENGLFIKPDCSEVPTAISPFRNVYVWISVWYCYLTL